MPKGQVTVQPIAKISRQAMAGLEAEAADVARYLDVEPRPLAIAG